VKNMNTKQKKAGYDRTDLDEMVGQAAKLGIGLAIVSKEALENLIKQKTKDSGVSEKEAKQAVADLVTESKRREKQLQEQVKKVLKTAQANNPVVLKKDVLKMKTEIAKLKQKLKKK